MAFAIKDPTLLVDEAKVRTNIQRMSAKADANKLSLKPHFKTHQSIQIGQWFRELGVDKITVSSIKMAEHFAKNGWEDITIAFPVNILKLNDINKLAGSINLSILISDPNTIQPLIQSITSPLGIYIEIDTGSGRTGFLPADTRSIRETLDKIAQSSTLTVRGFYSHPGHSYNAQSEKEIQSIHDNAVQKVGNLKSRFADHFPELLGCIGDTPCASVAENWEGIDEISPGNFVFYDLTQATIGSCKINDIAIALACPVVAKYPRRQELVIHAGAVHLSKDSIVYNSKPYYGKVVRLNKNFTWDEPEQDCIIRSLSQEHGIVKCSHRLFNDISTGELIGILPIHSCLTADSMQGYKIVPSLKPADHRKGKS